MDDTSMDVSRFCRRVA